MDVPSRTKGLDNAATILLPVAVQRAERSRRGGGIVPWPPREVDGHRRGAGEPPPDSGTMPRHDIICPHPDPGGVRRAGHLAGRMAGAVGGSWPCGLRGGQHARRRSPAHGRWCSCRGLAVRTRTARRTSAPAPRARDTRRVACARIWVAGRPGDDGHGFGGVCRRVGTRPRRARGSRRRVLGVGPERPAWPLPGTRASRSARSPRSLPASSWRTNSPESPPKRHILLLPLHHRAGPVFHRSGYSRPDVPRVWLFSREGHAASLRSSG
jgi:hypothetical protein